MGLDLTRLSDAVRYEGGVTRRLAVAYAMSLSAVPWLGLRGVDAIRRMSFRDDPFSLGVASGDPSPHGFVIWTRLAPRPLEPHGGLPPSAVSVVWEVADDESMRRVVASGRVGAVPELGHSVHVEVRGLEPDRWYWYRFRAGDATSAVGRTRTMPGRETMPERLRFAFASCQHFEQGLFTAYDHMATDDLDLVLHLGDYIYEYPGHDARIRRHVGAECLTLADYRLRHAQYKTDASLQAMHAACPWLVTWDDHEVENDIAGEHSQKRETDPAAFLARRAAAYQAYYEMMPLRRRSVPRGASLQLYRKATFGRLAQFHVLDTRQYRTDQPNGGHLFGLNCNTRDPRASILGRRQAGWLHATLRHSRATWNVIAQQVMIGMIDHHLGPGQAYSMDQWPGYERDREELLTLIRDERVANPVVLTGDVHSNWANEVRLDDRKHDEPVVLPEFVTTSISTGGNGFRSPASIDRLKSQNPGVRYHNAERGYTRCVVEKGVWRTDFQVVEDVMKPGAPKVTRASVVVESGRPEIMLA